MKERRNPLGVFGKTLYFTDREIDQMCFEALKNSGFYPSSPSPIEIESFVEKHFETTLDFGTSMGEGVLGWTLFGRNGKIQLVGISAQLAEDLSEVGIRRCRATVAHEAGHCLMHSSLFMEEAGEQMFGNIDLKMRRILCREDDIAGKYDGRWWEVQANKAIGGLLLPKGLVQTAVEKFLESAGALGLPVMPEKNRKLAIDYVAKTFEVNKKPAEIRLEKLFPNEEVGFL